MDRRTVLRTALAAPAAPSLGGCLGSGRDVEGEVSNATDRSITVEDSWLTGTELTYEGAFVIVGTIENETADEQAFPTVSARLRAESGDEATIDPSFCVVGDERVSNSDRPTEIGAGEQVTFRFIYESDEAIDSFEVLAEN
ncbi:hypothetical protein ACNS7O_02720 [Haloferacaceae archaeon DSL9]